MKTRFLFLSGFFLLAISVFAFASNHTNSTCVGPECRDSDGGIENATRGTCNPGNLTDFCLTNATLVEFYCRDGNCLNTTISCQFGCLDGRCLGESNTTCLDTDGGINNLTKGVCKQLYHNGTIISEVSDFCNNNTLVEYYCQNGVCANTTITCPAGCSEGRCACQQEPACTTPGCTDTDGGINNETKGTCTQLLANGTILKNTDYCQNNQTLIEYYCDGVNCRNTTINCPLGCSDGKCVGVCKDNCTDSDGGIDNSTRGTCNPGNLTDYCQNRQTLIEYYCNNGVCANTTINCPLGCKNGACIAPLCTLPGCTDTDGGINNVTRGTCTTTLSNGTTINNTDYCQNNQTLVEYYCNNGVCANTTINCTSGCSNGACVLPSCVGPLCTDTDGGINNATRGTCNPGNLTDYCLTNTTLVEYYCQNGVCANTTIQCPNACSNGACITILSACTDTDGGINYAVRGTASTATRSRTDACRNNRRLKEFYCVGDRIADRTASCRCRQGACIGQGGVGSVPPAFNLFDSIWDGVEEAIALITDLFET